MTSQLYISQSVIQSIRQSVSQTKYKLITRYVDGIGTDIAMYMEVTQTIQWRKSWNCLYIWQDISDWYQNNLIKPHNKFIYREHSNCIMEMFLYNNITICRIMSLVHDFNHNQYYVAKYPLEFCVTHIADLEYPELHRSILSIMLARRSNITTVKLHINAR